MNDNHLVIFNIKYDGELTYKNCLNKINFLYLITQQVRYIEMTKILET